MDLVNGTGMSGAYTLGLDPDGRERVVVVVKGTFVIPPRGGIAQLAEEQDAFEPRSTVSNAIPGAIVDRIKKKIAADQPFHAYIVMPMFPEGKPNGDPANAQRYFEFQTMRFMAQEVFAAADAKGRDWRDYLSFHFLVNWTDLTKDAPQATVVQRVRLAGSREERVRANQRYQVYVHSKLMIIDDQFMILGSANLNERSLAGNRDTEICLYLSPDDGKLSDCQPLIKKLRTDAWSRHFAGNLPANSDSPESPACAQAFASAGRGNWMMLSAAARQDQSQLITYPFTVTKGANGLTFSIDSISANPVLKIQDPFLFDAKADAAGSDPANGTTSDAEWRWQSVLPSNFPIPYQSLAE
jgi:phosphatidylserine/phosphatidylglycerophosphate/cardiolipin synthase-like enzyme